MPLLETTAIEAETRPAHAARPYRADIDGLRAIAITAVVLHHAAIPHLTGGFTGVDIFFVISGFLIGGQIDSDLRANTFSFLRFYQRRARRILPALYAVLFATLAAALILLSPTEARLFARENASAALSISNIVFWATANYFDARSSLHPLLMTWSLGVEEQFYAVIPLLMLLLTRIKRSLVLPTVSAACALSFLLAWRELSIYPSNVFYLLPERAWELGAGVLLAMLQSRHITRLPQLITNLLAVTGLLGITAPLFLYTGTQPFPGPRALAPVLGTALLIATPESWINRRLLSLAPITFTGKISYSWYLWHWPLFAFARLAVEDTLPLSAAITLIAISFLLATLSWRFIEQPFRHSQTPPIPLLTRCAAITFTVCILCTALWFTHGLPQRYPQLAQQESSAQQLLTDPCLQPTRVNKPNLTSPCFPVASQQPILTLWGDSHAAALAPALRSIAAAHNMALAELTKNSCTPLLGATHTIPRIPQLAAACEQFNQATFNTIRNDSRVKAVILTAAWSAPLNRNWMDGWLTTDTSHTSTAPSLTETQQLYLTALTRTAQQLQASGKQVILIADTPSFPFDPLLRLRIASIPARRALAALLGSPVSLTTTATPNADSETQLAASILQQAAAANPKLTLFNPTPNLCSTPQSCAWQDITQNTSTLLYLDSAHVTAAGATRALRSFTIPAQ